VDAEARRRKIQRFGEHYPVWLALALRLEVEINAIDPTYDLREVKENWSGLAYCVTMSETASMRDRERVSSLIIEAEYESTDICELCEQLGFLDQDGDRFMLRCLEHRHTR
jgi:hypothetical protein